MSRNLYSALNDFFAYYSQFNPNTTHTQVPTIAHDIVLRYFSVPQEGLHRVIPIHHLPSLWNSSHRDGVNNLCLVAVV